MGQLNPFNYHVAEIAKALIAFVLFGGYVATFFVTVQPGLVVAISGLVVPAVGVITVFAWGNHEASAFNKAFITLITAAITVAQYFTKVGPSTQTKLFVAAGALATFLGVLFKSNAPLGSKARRPHRVQHRA